MAITLKDVAKLAGTSVTAASTVLNGSSAKSTRVSQETRERIYAAAAQLGYVSNPIAKSLATGKTGVLGLMLPYEDAFIDQNPFCTTLIAGIIHEAFGRGFNIMLYAATSGMSPNQAAMLVDSRVDGVLVVMAPEDGAIFLKCERQQMPYVSVLRTPRPGALTVNSDDYAGGRLATEHLIRLGHRRIAHLVGHATVTTSAPRRQGYLDALAAAGIAHDPELEIASGFDRKDGYEGVLRMLRFLPKHQRPTAIFACNDLSAAGALQALAESGVSVPDEMAVVGYDDTRFCEAIQPPLTSVRMPIEEMGALAARMLISKIANEDVPVPQAVLPVSLTIRQSCGANRAGDASAPSRTVLQ